MKRLFSCSLNFSFKMDRGKSRISSAGEKKGGIGIHVKIK